MKKNLLTFILAICTVNVFSQVPAAFNYQAVIRDASGEIISNTEVALRISILQGSEYGNIVYAEIHNVITNNFGLVNLIIGEGDSVNGIFSPGGWGIDSHFIKVEIDLEGSNSFIHMGTSELNSVPYAFHAQTVEEDQVEDADADPLNELQTLSLDGRSLSLSNGGGSILLPESEDENEEGDDWGSQVAETDATITGDGTSGNPLRVAHSKILPDWTNLQGIPVGFADDVDDVDDADADPANELQTLSISGTLLTLSDGGGTVTLPSSGSGGDNWGSQVAVTDATLTGDGTTTNPLGVANSQIEPDWANIQGLPAGFADGEDNVQDGDANSVNEIQTLSKSGQTISLSYGGSVTDDVDDADADPANELQSLSLDGSTLTLSKNGGSVNLPVSEGDGDNWGTQVAQTDESISGDGTSGNPLGVQHGELLPEWDNIQNIPADFADNIDNVDDGDNNPGNEIQQLSLLGDELSITGGNAVILPDEVEDDDADPTNELQTWGTLPDIPADIADGDDVDDADNDPANELQTISISGTQLTLSDGGGTITLPSSGDGGDNWGTQAAATDATITGDGSPGNPLGVVQGELIPEWANLQGIPVGFADDVDNVEDADSDPTNELQMLSKTGNTIFLSDGGSVTDEVTDQDADPTNELQSISKTGNTIHLSDGGSVTDAVNDADHNPTNELQTLSKTGNTIYLSNGGSVTDDVNDADHNPTNELQTISKSGNIISLSNGGGSVNIPNNEVFWEKGETAVGEKYIFCESNVVIGELQDPFGYPLEVGGYTGIYVEAESTGIIIHSSSSAGLECSTDYGHFAVRGYNNRNYGTLGGENYGVYGEHDNGNFGELGDVSGGVYGKNSNGNYGRIGAGNAGVFGKYSNGPYGQLGTANSGVYGVQSTGDYAGNFNGDVRITGHLTKGSGTFKIDHPLDPANKYLSHSFVESPDMMNIYNGNVKLNANGEAVIQLPEYFDALNMEFSYQLTCIGGFANVFIAEKIYNNQFKISGGSPGLEVSWMVTGIRKDAYANMNRIRVEENKEADEVGKYLHPKAFGLPEEMGISYEEQQEFTENLAEETKNN